MIKRVYFPLPSVLRVHLHGCFELGQIPVLGSPTVQILKHQQTVNLLLEKRKISKFSPKWSMSGFVEH